MRYAKIIFSVAVLMAVAVLSSCTREPELAANPPGVRLRLHISTNEEQVVTTRTAESEQTVNDLYVMVLDGENDSAVVIDWVEASTAGSSVYYASLAPTTTQGYVCVAANISRTIAALGDVTWPGLTLAEVKEKLKVQLRKSGQYIVEDPTFAPMVSPIQNFSATDAIKNATSIDFKLKRATAKVTVYNNTGNRNFTLLGANIGNAPTFSHLFEGGTAPQPDDCAHYAGLVSGNTYSPEVMMRGLDKLTRNSTEPLYLFESPATNATFVIIKCQYDGVTGYHRVNLWDPKTETHIPISRNVQYRLLITKVSAAGYASALEAIADSNPINRDIEVDIEVTDPVSKDIVSNGDYYLGVSNSKFVVYSDKELTQYLVASVAHNAPEGITGTITAKTIDGEGLITITTNPFKPSTGTVQTGDLRITLPANLIQGEVILRLGNLSRRLSIERRKDGISVGGNIPLSRPYAYGKVNGDGDQWLRLAADGSIPFDDAVAEYVNPGTDRTVLYMSLADNVVYDQEELSPRTSEMILFNAEDDGHTRVAVFQPPFDVFGKPDEGWAVIANPYVGAFWRHNQTGERVIKMSITPGAGAVPTSLSWDAQVAVGHDWIRLQMGPSSDPNIYNVNAMLGDDVAFEGLHQLTDKSKTALHGNGDQLLFRIGLTGNKPYPTGQIGPKEHRYGLVVVNTYLDGNLQNIYRIFVRQGDAPDYLFRETDGGYAGWATPRSLAAKISAYNLTDPAESKGSAAINNGDEVKEGNLSKHSLMPLDYLSTVTSPTFNPAKFTKFPSQAGYFFVWNIRTEDVDAETLARNLKYARAYHPQNCTSLQHLVAGTGDHINGVLPEFSYREYPLRYNKTADPCPYGYRYPQLGVPHDNAATTFDATESELIQSLLYDPLAPKRGTDPEIMGKYTCWGYYADGFFDRLPINTKKVNSVPVNTLAMRATNIANASGNDIAYVGMVIFNPFNFSSIFIPATGRLDPAPFNQGNRVIQGGRETFMYVSERDQSRADGVCCPIDLNGSKGQFAIIINQGLSAQARPVRCVRDETLWPNNGE